MAKQTQIIKVKGILAAKNGFKQKLAKLRSKVGKRKA